MGYTHYWYRPQTLGTKETFAAAAQECRRVVEASGVAVTREYDTPATPPSFDADLILFNGVGDEGCETFFMPRVLPAEECRVSRKSDHGYLQFCKTQGRPYDLCATACLVVLKHRFPDLVVRSDGEDQDFAPARDLCQRILGYGESFKLHGE